MTLSSGDLHPSDRFGIAQEAERETGGAAGACGIAERGEAGESELPEADGEECCSPGKVITVSSAKPITF